MERFFNEKSILITGGTGSFGKQFVADILEKYPVKRIIIYSRDEYKQFKMKKQFMLKFSREKMAKIRFFIGDVRDEARLKIACRDVDFIVHAAALKQVPACEYNPGEAIKTNILGAMNIISAALFAGVKKVVALSTDKAVNPINLYGGTKLVSDKLFIAGNAYAGGKEPIFSVVRYGNVAGSRGSVIPFFAELVKQGSVALPVTHRDMTRFWMTLESASKLVIKALYESKGGETFVYKNPSFVITDLVKAMNGTGEIQEIGIRVGEKLHEIMITKEDSYTTYDYGDHYIIYPNFEWWNFEKYFKIGGKKVAENFEYSSNNNAHFLNDDEISHKIKAICIEY